MSGEMNLQKTYIPLIADIDAVGFYKDKIEGQITQEFYKILYFFEFSSRNKWLEGITKSDKQHRDLALKYLNCKFRIVPRLAILFQLNIKNIKITLFIKLNFFLYYHSLYFLLVSIYV